MNKIYVNLKDWLGYAENVDYAEQIEGLDIIVFPSLPYLYIYKDRNIRIGSQKISSYADGPHTGSISASHLKEFGVSAVLLNHKECLIDEEDKMCAKVMNAQKADMQTILCIGSSEPKDLDRIKSVLSKTGTKGISIAFEPYDEMPLDEIKIHLDIIKRSLADYDIDYIYGNNVRVENCELFAKELDVTGFLLSSHALSVDNLKNIISKLTEISK